MRVYVQEGFTNLEAAKNALASNGQALKYACMIEGDTFNHDWLIEPFTAPIDGDIFQIANGDNQFIGFVFIPTMKTTRTHLLEVREDALRKASDAIADIKSAMDWLDYQSPTNDFKALIFEALKLDAAKAAAYYELAARIEKRLAVK